MLKDHNAVTPVRFEPAVPRSRAKHCTTEPLRSLIVVAAKQTVINEVYFYLFSIRYRYNFIYSAN